jgi:uncharacterized membrane protein YoaK (UPF0700 family)
MVPALRQMSGRHRTETGDERLGTILAFVAGAINAGGFLAVGYYTSHMSGIVSSIADFLVLHRWAAALISALSVFSFFSGAVTSSLLINWARRKGLHSEFALTLMLEAVLLLLFGLLAWEIEVTVALLCFTMGLQNSLITKISHAEIRTTHVTGIVTDLGIECGRFLFERTTHTEARFHLKKVILLGRLLAGFLLGGITGALVFKWAGFITVLPFSLLLALIAIGPVWEDVSQRFHRKAP